MEQSTTEAPSSKTSRIITSLLLFCYFGFFVIAQLSLPFLVFWIVLFPFVFGALIITGLRGGIGLWRERYQHAVPNPYNKYRIWFASLGILWFLISIQLAGFTRNAYFPPTFDSEKWKSSDWEDSSVFERSLRERMLDDLINNALPGRSRTEIIEMLGQPDEIRDREGEETLFYYTGWNIMEPKCISINFDGYEIIKEYALTVCG